MEYKKTNVIIGWIVFAIATLTYALTIEPTASFWDCGEFITSGFKLEVGHPPGAPFFMIVARLFTLFAFDYTQVAMMVNLMSALASSFTILFLFWTITHIAKKTIIKTDADLNNTSKIYAILGSGIVGALAYTFSDTFWFSAVEGEVYAFSSLFTAIVFWAILKWENVANEKYANRWLIFIAYLMGLSIGVHLLNLLAIPAIVFIYYFKKYKVTKQGIIFTFFIAIAILGVIQYGIIPGIVSVAFLFERIFTNGFGAPYNTGSAIYAILVMSIIIFGVYHTYKKRIVLLNTVLLMFTVILIGYSSFALIVIRSLADPPMDQNNPDNVFSLLSYLNREQYGDRPLVYGQYFNSQVTDYVEKSPIYAQNNGKYAVVDHKIAREYSRGQKTIFPRMYSDQDSPPHIDGYMHWAGLKESDLFQSDLDENGNTRTNAYGEPIFNRNQPKEIPSFKDNLKFFFKYQIGHMYIRYFMWNFVGRQSDIQNSSGDIINGNWISGIPFIDSLRIGPQDNVPDNMKNNKGRNTYFFFPLILGILGLIFLFNKNNKDFWVIMLLFIFTGLAIIVYTNQPPYQPRERDYAYAGSFYAFAIYIGIGVLGLYEYLKKLMPANISAISSTVVAIILVPTIMVAQNWDDHDRSQRYTARDFAHNYLNSCAPNAILFTNGDNDTFPLWYAQEVEGIRTDVRVINLSYFNTDWYINQMTRRAYKSAPVPFTLTPDKYAPGKRDLIYLYENPNLYLDERYEAHKKKYEAKYIEVYQELIKVLDASKFPEMAPKDYKTISGNKENLSPAAIYSLAKKLNSDKIVAKFDIEKQAMEGVLNKAQKLKDEISQAALPIDKLMTFLAKDTDDAKIRLQDGKLHNYLPTNKILIPVDPETVVKNGVVPEKDKDKVAPIELVLNRSYIRKSDLMVLDILAANNWERPVYFAITVGHSAYMNLEPYFQLDGLAYRVVPIKTNNNDRQTGRINTDILYDNIMNNFKWGGINNPEVYLDENNLRMLMNMKNNFARLAKQLLLENKKEKAIEVLDKCAELMPNELIPYNYYNLLIAEVYYLADEKEKADDIINILADTTTNKLKYFLSLDKKYDNMLDEEKERSLAIMQEILRISNKYSKETFKKLESKFQQILYSNAK